LLDGERDRDTPRAKLVVTVPDHVVVGADHQADLTIAGVGEVVQDVIEKGAARGEQGLDSTVRGGGLLGRQPNRGVGSSHSRAQACGENNSPSCEAICGAVGHRTFVQGGIGGK
jgi:hypothetical protein